MPKYQIISFYKFVNMQDLQSLKIDLLCFCNQKMVKGTIMIANEGINATLSAKQESINQLCHYLKDFHVFNGIEFQISSSEDIPFKKMKVKIKKEIVNFNVPTLDLSRRGNYLSPQKWDEIIVKDNTILIDTRNYYEYAIGTFKGAINPHIHHFTELPRWLESNMQEKNKKQNIAMFCTGGIRCEKSTAYMKQLGFQNVYHLKNGIIKYLENNRENFNSNWRGKCFVFDDRIIYS